MKAARLEDGTLEIQDLPIPVPGEEEALIRISSAGVCHSDLHIVRGDWCLNNRRSEAVWTRSPTGVKNSGRGELIMVATTTRRDDASESLAQLGVMLPEVAWAA